MALAARFSYPSLPPAMKTIPSSNSRIFMHTPLVLSRYHARRVLSSYTHKQYSIVGSRRLAKSSTKSRNYLSTDSKSNSDKASSKTNPGELPKFSLLDLGASPTVKFVVYLSLGIIGTLETYAYGKWAWHKWGPKGETAEQEHETSALTSQR